MGSSSTKGTPGDQNGGIVWIGGFGVLEVLPDHLLEGGEYGIVYGELPVQIIAHLALHLVDLAQGEHALGDDAPGLVGVGVVAHDL